jgi:hypothetical protein
MPPAVKRRVVKSTRTVEVTKMEMALRDGCWVAGIIPYVTSSSRVFRFAMQPARELRLDFPACSLELRLRMSDLNDEILHAFGAQNHVPQAAEQQQFSANACHGSLA